jgi:hypothetical protein
MIAAVSSRASLPPWLIVGALLTVGLAVRVQGLDELPFEFHPTRQYRSMLIAQSYFYENNDTVPEWKRHVSATSAAREGRLEPPLMERAAAFAFTLAGNKPLWIPRLMSVLCWLMGGVLLYAIARRFLVADGAVFATAFYLFLPFGILASRCFQPDSLMLALQLLTILLLLRYFEHPTFLRIAAATAAAGAAIFVKPVAVFVIFAAYVALEAIRRRERRAVGASGALFVLGSLLPAAMYYVPGVVGSEALAHQAESSFQPSLLLDPSYWQLWMRQIRVVVGFTAFVGALLGLTLSRNRPLLLALWSGYVAFCLAFPYHIHTHDYYHLQLVPIVALSLGPLAEIIADRLRTIEGGFHWRRAPTALLVLSLVLAIATSVRAAGERVRAEGELPRREAQVAEAIGNAIGQSTDAVVLASNYGKVLAYHGDIAVVPWPYRYDIRDDERLAGRPITSDEIFRRISAQVRPEFFVVTDSAELSAQRGLRLLLETRYSRLVETPDYTVFRLRPDQNRLTTGVITW